MMFVKIIQDDWRDYLLDKNLKCIIFCYLPKLVFLKIFLFVEDCSTNIQGILFISKILTVLTCLQSAIIPLINNWHKALKLLWAHRPHKVICTAFAFKVSRDWLKICAPSCAFFFFFFTRLCVGINLLVMHLFWYKIYFISKEKGVNECIITFLVQSSWAPLRLRTWLLWVCSRDQSRRKMTRQVGWPLIFISLLLKAKLCDSTFY